MKTITSITISCALIGIAMMQGGCMESEPDPELDSEEAAVEMTPWTGTPRPEIAEALSQRAGGVQINENQIAWDDGTVVLTIPDEQQPSLGEEEALLAGTVHRCPSGWYCFYEHATWEGRILRFSSCSFWGTSQNLSDYGFANQASSWLVNRSLDVVKVYGGFRLLWKERAHSSSAWVGAAANDKADRFTCYK